MRLLLLAGCVVVLSGCVREISGHVLDCDTGEPVAGAVVSANQTGWGWSEQGWLVWDKTYRTETGTDAAGYFQLTWTHGSSARLQAERKGYFTAEQFEYPASEVRIGLRKGDNRLEFTRYCRMLSQCLQCNVIDGVQECRDTCTNEALYGTGPDAIQAGKR